MREVLKQQELVDVIHYEGGMCCRKKICGMDGFVDGISGVWRTDLVHWELWYNFVGKTGCNISGSL